MRIGNSLLLPESHACKCEHFLLSPDAVQHTLWQRRMDADLLQGSSMFMGLPTGPNGDVMCRVASQHPCWQEGRLYNNFRMHTCESLYTADEALLCGMSQVCCVLLLCSAGTLVCERSHAQSSQSLAAQDQDSCLFLADLCNQCRLLRQHPAHI